MLMISIGGDNSKLNSSISQSTQLLQIFGNSVSHTVSTSFSSMLKFGVVFNVVEAGLRRLTSLAGSPLGMLKKGFSEAMNVEDLSVSFRVMLGSAEATKRAVEDLYDFADESPFESEKVIQSGRQILAYGFAVEEMKDILRDAGDLAAGMNKPLEQSVAIFGKLRAGDFGGAFQGLRDAFGVSRQELEAQGLIFDKSGSYKGSVDQAMTAVRAIIQGKFGGTMKDLSVTTRSQILGLQERIQAVFREFAAPISSQIGPIIEKVASFVRELVPIAQRAGQTIASVVSGIITIFESGLLQNALSVGLRVAFGEGLNYLTGGLFTFLDLLGAGLKTLFSGQFLAGLGYVLESLGAKLSQILLKAFEKPIRHMQASVQWVMESAMDEPWKRRQGEDLERQAADARAKARDFRASADLWSGQAGGEEQERAATHNAMIYERLAAQLDDQRAKLGLGRTYDQIYAETDPTIAGRDNAALAQQSEEAAKKAAALMESPLREFVADIQKTLGDFSPADIADTSGARSELERFIAVVRAKMDAAFPADIAGGKKPPAPGGGSSEGAEEGKNLRGIIASSLARIGGGGGVAGSATLDRDRNRILREIKGGIDALVKKPTFEGYAGATMEAVAA